jgi:hypothetical protein
MVDVCILVILVLSVINIRLCYLIDRFAARTYSIGSRANEQAFPTDLERDYKKKAPYGAFLD